MFIIVIDQPVVFLLPCLSSQAMHSTHTGKYYEIFKQGGEQISSKIDEVLDFHCSQLGLTRITFNTIFLNQIIMSSSVNCSVIRESSNRLLTALKRKFKDLDTRNIFLILKIAYILSLLSFVVIEGFDESGSECLIMIVLL